MSHTSKENRLHGRVVRTEMTGRVPGIRGPRGSRMQSNPGGIPTQILDASSSGVRAPKATQVMRENRVPKVRQGLGRRG